MEPPWTGKRCDYCTPAAGRKPPAVIVREVACPPDRVHPRWRLRMLAVDRWPHPDGVVVRDPDGSWRILSDPDEAVPGQARYRVHGAEACAGITSAVVRR